MNGIVKSREQVILILRKIEVSKKVSKIRRKEGREERGKESK
jgi:hypothetical protein